MTAATFSPLIALALAGGLVLAVAAGLRLVGGATGLRLAGAAVPAGVLVAWVVLHGVPVKPRGLGEVAIHITLGGLLLGLALDAVAAWRQWSPRAVGRWLWPAGTGYALFCVWAALGRPRALPGDPSLLAGMTASALVLALGWAVVLERLARHLRPGGAADGGVLLTAMALGVGAAALALGARGQAVAAGGLALAALLYAGVQALAARRVADGPALPASVLLGGGGAVAGLAQALALDWPGGAAAVAVLAFLPFVESTAARLPPPRLKAVWTLALALLPALLAAAAAIATRR